MSHQPPSTNHTGEPQMITDARPPGRAKLRALTFLRLFAASIFASVGAVAAGAVLFCWMVGYFALGAVTYTVVGAIVAAASYGAFVCLRPPRQRAVWDEEAWLAGAPQNHRIPADHDVAPSAELDEAMERLQESLDGPAYLPPHEYRVRPPHPRGSGEAGHG